MIEWQVANIHCSSDTEVLTVDLNNAKFGAEIRPEISDVVRDVIDFIIASKATAQDLIELREIWELRESERFK